MLLQPQLLIPFLCAFVYVLGALTLKRAGQLGVGVWRTSFVANWLMFIVFVPWWFGRGGAVHPLAEYWQPAATGLCFLGGQVFLFLALGRGDVSVTTPVMGAKVLLVALFSSLLRVGEVPLRWWVGAALSAGAVGLLHAGEHSSRRRQVGLTVVLAALSATAYSLGDVLMQKWVPAWGTGSFFPAMFLIVGLYSFAFVPFFHAPLPAMSGQAWRWVGLGGLLMAVNNAGIVLTIGIWGGATAVNIVYSARGLVSVGLVWAVGHWFASAEQHLPPRVLRFRLVGAGLMLAAIALVLAG
jgi:drug/metabolite transporter (DMT)-like permease